MGDTMRTRTIASALAAAALLTLTACESTDDTSTSKPDSTAQDGQAKQDTSTTEAATETPDSTTDADDADDAAAESAALPNLVGQDLQTAQDEAQAAGFYVLDDQDASGQDRLQVLDRNWVVCSQEPAAGTHPTDTPVVLYAVKDDETC